MGVAAKLGRKSKQLQRGPVPSEGRGAGLSPGKTQEASDPHALVPATTGALGSFFSQTPPGRAQGA